MPSVRGKGEDINMLILGVSAFSHDAAISLVNSDNNEILFAAHSERYNRIKNTDQLCEELFQDCFQYGVPDQIVFYEKPWLKKLRQFYAGQYKDCFLDRLPSYKLKKYIGNKPIEYVEHHRAHAASAFLSPFNTACVVVIDAIGEFDCISVWKYDIHSNVKLQKLASIEYPHSLGLFYSAFTELIGLKPNEDEYIMMGLSAYARPELVPLLSYLCFEEDSFKTKYNFHLGVKDIHDFSKYPHEMIAASVQSLMTTKVMKVMEFAKALTGESNLVYSGGVALNCAINTQLYQYFDNVWILPNPGDAGTSLGAVAAYIDKPIHWKSPYLGHDISGEYPIDKLLNELLNKKIVGVANGRAEFGPRALGNRSIFADPRGTEVKDTVNLIKLRQQYRPFAPVVLEEYFRYYYDVPIQVKDAKYMQYVFKNTYSDFPAVTHVDRTSRIQTVNKLDHPMLHELLTQFYNKTGCPMLLNTSLNIKGQPIVNDEKDVTEFIAKYGIPVYTQS